MSRDIRPYDLARLIARGLPDERRAGHERELAAADQHDALDELSAMTADERVAAMRAGELSLDELAAWSRRSPHEVPKIGGEFEWIVASTADWLEASQTRAPATSAHNRRSSE